MTQRIVEIVPLAQVDKAQRWWRNVVGLPNVVLPPLTETVWGWSRHGASIVAVAWAQRHEDGDAQLMPLGFADDGADTAWQLVETLVAQLAVLRQDTTIRLLTGSADDLVIDSHQLARLGFQRQTTIGVWVSPAAALWRGSGGDRRRLKLRQLAVDRRFTDLVGATFVETDQRQTFYLAQSPQRLLEQWRQECGNDCSEWLTVEVDEREVGCLILDATPTALSINLLYVGLIPAARGQGLGRRLLRAIGRFPRYRGRPLVAMVDSADSRATAAYAGAGWTQRGSRELWRRACHDRS